ncbi:MAG: hypothetical protein NZ528_09020 [Caldilineales bacterium]|nr:hypothetical protein [Caldilineales bacterium]
MSDASRNTCIHCGRNEAEIPLTAWRLAGENFWICPDCLPFLIHRRNEIMPRLRLAGWKIQQNEGESHAER